MAVFFVAQFGQSRRRSISISVAVGGVGEGLERRIAGAAILLLALLKSRTILSRYLALDEAPSLRRGFNLVLSIFFALLLALYLIGGTTA